MKKIPNDKIHVFVNKSVLLYFNILICTIIRGIDL